MNQLENERRGSERSKDLIQLKIRKGENMNFQSSKKTRDLIVEMLKEYPLNCKKYSKLNNDKTVMEWKMDYLTRQDAGGLKSGGTPSLQPIEKGYNGKYASIEEALLMEEENVVDRIYELKIQIQIVKLLILSLREDMYDLVDLRYFKRKSVQEICEVYFCSRSTFYRKNNEIIDFLAVEYEQLFVKTKDWGQGLYARK